MNKKEFEEYQRRGNALLGQVVRVQLRFGPQQKRVEQMTFSSLYTPPTFTEQGEKPNYKLFAQMISEDGEHKRSIDIKKIVTYLENGTDRPEYITE